MKEEKIILCGPDGTEIEILVRIPEAVQNCDWKEAWIEQATREIQVTALDSRLDA